MPRRREDGHAPGCPFDASGEVPVCRCGRLESKPFTPQEQERRARAAHTQVVAIADSLDRMTCPSPVSMRSCSLCDARAAVEALRFALARLT